MFLELFNNTFIDSSIFYMYFGVVLMTMGIMYFVNLHHNTPVVYEYSFGGRHQNIKINKNQMGKTLIINEPFMIWLIITFKRIDQKDDKIDNLSSCFKNEFKIRGGQLWKNMAYSQPLKNTGF
ncbi:hypothetical protein MKY30_12220 [Oceanobacillus sp. FSL W8-0428]|uniref:Uncharacterized protein n=1 Tax=Oceanobacillus sojae TaxID=582851 RepID=A0A511ZP50_9BACI|nr:hypothetical protein [Oceanobacillus sojae]GEN89218.1 hypothetical protein OSO01_39570 [Oceanobacillus sojae]